MIWMGVGGPGDFVAPLNRFPATINWLRRRKLFNFQRIRGFCDIIVSVSNGARIACQLVGLGTNKQTPAIHAREIAGSALHIF